MPDIASVIHYPNFMIKESSLICIAGKTEADAVETESRSAAAPDCGTDVRS